MSDYTLDVDGAIVPITGGNLTLPFVGAWTFDGLLAAEEVPPEGARVALVLRGQRRRGAVARAGADYKQARVRVVGGAGKLDAVIEGRDYRGYLAHRIVADILRDAGEVVGDGWAAFDTYCAHWLRATGPARDCLRRLMRIAPAGLRWRPNADGALALYRDQWAEVSPDFYDRDEASWPHEHLVRMAPASTELEPGMSFIAFGLTRRAGRVEYRFEDGNLRCDVWLET